MPHNHGHDEPGRKPMTREAIAESLHGEITDICIKSLFQGMPEVGGLISFELGVRLGCADPALARLCLDWLIDRLGGENREAVANITDVVDDMVFHIGEAIR